MYSSTAPTAEQIARALERCRPAARGPAAVHLATPVDAVVGMDVWRDEGWWRWRAAAVPMSSEHESIEVHAATAVELAAAGARSEDRWLDLSEEPGFWGKPCVSGVRKIVFGLTLLGGPGITADAGLSDEVVLSLAAAAMNGDLELPSLVAVGGTPVLVSGSDVLVRACAVREGGDVAA
jgi:hypothetical protein